MRLTRIAPVAGFLLFALALPARAGGGLVELVLPNQQPVSATNPLPVSGTFSAAAPTGTTPVNQIGTSYTSSDVIVGTVSTALIAADPTRNYLLIQNKGSQPIQLAFGAAATTNSGITIGIGGNYEALHASRDAVNAIAPTGSSLITVVRGN